MLGEIPMEEDLAAANAPKKVRKQTIDLSSLEPPPPEIWTLEKPNIAAFQDDIIKLSAQFVARNGAIFTNGLMEREQKVFIFFFLFSFSSLTFLSFFFLSFFLILLFFDFFRIDNLTF